MSATWAAVVLFMGWFGTVDPQHFPAGTTIRRDEVRGTIRWLEGADLGAGLEASPAVAAARRAEDPGALVLAILDARRLDLGLDAPVQELKVAHVEREAGGASRLRLTQVHRGVPVEGAELSAHLDGQRRLRLVSGRYVRTPSAAEPRATLERSAAVAAAAAAVGVPVRALRDPAVNLVWYPDDRGVVQLAYRVSVDLDLIRKEQVFVEATHGAVIARVATSFPIDAGGRGVVGP